MKIVEYMRWSMVSMLTPVLAFVCAKFLEYWGSQVRGGERFLKQIDSLAMQSTEVLKELNEKDKKAV